MIHWPYECHLAEWQKPEVAIANHFYFTHSISCVSLAAFSSIFLISPYSNISSFDIYASLHQFIKYRLLAAMRLLLLISSCLLVLCSADFCGINKIPYGFEAHKDGGVALLCTRPECHEKKFAVRKLIIISDGKNSVGLS